MFPTQISPSSPAVSTREPAARHLRANALARAPKPTWRTRLGAAARIVWAFATLEDGDRVEASTIETHPHRRALQPDPRSRRPGAVSARPQACLSPTHRPTRHGARAQS